MFSLIRAVRECLALWFAAAWRLRRGALPALVAIAIAEGVGVAVLSPLGAAGVNWLVRQSGRYAVANEDLVGFFVSPVGAATVLVAFTVTVALTGLGRSAALVAMLEAEGGARASGVVSFARALRRAGAILELAARQVLIAGAVALPFVAVIGGIAWATLRGVDLYWMVNTRPARFWIGAGCIAPVAVVGAWFVGKRVLSWSVSLPLCVLCGRSARSALRESAGALSGRLAGVAVARLGWIGANGALAIGVLLGVRAVAERALAWDFGGLTGAAVVAGLALLAHGAAVFVMTLVGKLGDTAVVFGAWRRYAGGVAVDRSVSEAGAGRDGRSWARLKWKALGVLGSGAVVGGIATAGLIATATAPIDIEITAHRGAAVVAPENTLAAIRAAAEQGADRVELDAVLTSDGAVVLFHDTDLRRIAGDPRRIAAMTLDEVRAVDAGSWFGPGFAGERIPTLEEAIDLAGALGVKLNIEMKTAPGGGDEAVLAERVTRALRERADGGGKGAVITTLSARALVEARRTDPNARIGLIVTASVGDLRRVDADLLSVEAGLVTRRFLAQAADAGLAVHVWGVHDEALFTRLALEGVEGVITPDPGAMARRREELRGLSEVERLLVGVRGRLGGNGPVTP